MKIRTNDDLEIRTNACASNHTDEIESAGEILRGSGNSADKNKRRKQIWKDIAAKLNSAHGNGRAVEDIRKKWTNLKLNAKSKVDASFREVRKTGGVYTQLEM